MRSHWQNLDEKKGGSILREGRGWIYIGNLVINPEWHFGGRRCMAHINIGGGDSGRDLQFSLGIPFVGQFYLTFERLLPEWLTDGRMTESYLHPGEMFRMPIERQIGFSVHNGTIWLSLWEIPGEWSKTDPWWWQFNWKPANTFLGRQRYNARTILETQAMVVLPEASYPVTVKLFESTWKRPRWPWIKRIMRADITSENGIPSHAGKGENSWDLDDDALYSLVCMAETVDEAVKRTAEHILASRKRYGNPSIPEPQP